jgi:ribosomal protein S18 acetylase RimI-like enzyme
VTADVPARDIRLAFVGEAKAITALIERAYRGDESRRAWTTEADILTGPRTTVEEIKGLLADPQSRFLVAADGGALSACALIRNEDGVGYFGMFAVRPDLQGAGLGRAMLAAAERQARALWNCRAMTMTVISLRKDLIGYYERRGYKLTGEQKPFPFAPDLGALRTDFHLAVLRKELA